MQVKWLPTYLYLCNASKMIAYLFVPICTYLYLCNASKMIAYLFVLDLKHRPNTRPNKLP